MLTSLPNEVQIRVLSLLVTLADLSRISRVSKSLHQLVQKSPSLWEEIAERKYGRDVAQRTASHYGGNWKNMLRDDNRNGALLAVTRTAVPSKMWKSNYIHNSDGYYFCCLMGGLKYDRLKNMLYLYLDVRGELDLRHPATSHMVWKPRSAGTFHARRVTRRVETYVSLIETERPGHYKGVVGIHLGSFSDTTAIDEPGTWEFLFANRHPPSSDYEPIILFDLDRGQSIESTIPTLQGFHYSLRLGDEEHPFTDDTEEIERRRWQSHAPQRVLERWWAGHFSLHPLLRPRRLRRRLRM